MSALCSSSMATVMACPALAARIMGVQPKQYIEPLLLSVQRQCMYKGVHVANKCMQK